MNISLLGRLRPERRAAHFACASPDRSPSLTSSKFPFVRRSRSKANCAFLDAVRHRTAPVVDGAAGRRALALADRVMAGILEHSRGVQLGAFASQQANP